MFSVLFLLRTHAFTEIHKCFDVLFSVTLNCYYRIGIRMGSPAILFWVKSSLRTLLEKDDGWHSHHCSLLEKESIQASSVFHPRKEVLLVVCNRKSVCIILGFHRKSYSVFVRQRDCWPAAAALFKKGMGNLQ